MNANDIQNKEAYEGIKSAMLKEGVIPKEIIKYSEEMKEKERLKETQSKTNDIKNPIGETSNALEAFTKQYSNLSPILIPIKIIVKRADGTLKIIDLVLEYQINGNEGVLIKIGEEVISSITFSAGTAISSVIATKVALILSVIDEDFGVVVGFSIFSNGIILSNWLADQSKELVHFAYEYIYIPTQNTFIKLKNGFAYLLSGNWFNDFLIITSFGNPETKQILQYKLENNYGDEVDDMDNFEKDYRMLFGR